jgi:hypothetical protein
MTDPAAPKAKWYHTTSAVVIGLAVAGPLALPLVWIQPRWSPLKKILWTVAVLALTWAMVTFTVEVGQKVLDQYRELGLIQ